MTVKVSMIMILYIFIMSAMLVFGRIFNIKAYQLMGIKGFELEMK